MSEKSTPPPAESLSAEKQQADIYLKEIAESHKKIKEHESAMFQRLDHISNVSDNSQRKYDKIEELYKKSLDNDGKINNFLEQTRQKSVQADNHLASTETALNLSKGDHQESVKEHEKAINVYRQISELLESIQKEEEKIQNLLERIEASDSAIANYHENLLIDEPAPEDEEPPRKSIQTEISDFFESAKKRKEEHEKETENLHTKIKSLLLPGATAYGLSSSYKESKLEIAERCLLWAGFVVSLLLLGSFYFYYLYVVELGTDIEIAILTRIAIGSPFIWAAWYCQRTLSERQKIKEEYKHKQKMMLLYDGFMTQIQALGEGDKDKALQNKMVGIMLDAIKKNPAEFIGTPDTIIESKAKAIANKIPFFSSSNKKETK